LVKKKLSVAIFGGSFDPPHKGHQQIVAQALETLDDIDKLIIVPAYLNPFKTETLASPRQRLTWCQTLFDNLESVEVSDFEIAEGKPTYTATTLKYFQQRYSVKYLIIGADNLEKIHTWHAFSWLNQQVTWVIASRAGYKKETSPLQNTIHLPVNKEISSTHIRSLKQPDATGHSIDERIKPSVIKKLKEINANS
jgi:nicotinate-nucleotide adenylyltransferase